MLTRKEKAVMKIIFQASNESKNALVTPDFILNKLNVKFNIDKLQLESILKKLHFDEYFEWITSQKNGDTVFVFNLLLKGAGFARQLEVERNKRIRWLIVTVAGAVLSFAIGYVLRRVFF